MPDTVTAFPTDHVAPAEVFAVPDPLAPALVPDTRRTPAEEARTLVAGTTVATLSTLSDDGHPWGSLVQYGLLDDGSPVLCVSTLAEHGRNLVRDQRASLVIGEADPVGDVLDSGRVTLAGVMRAPEGEELEAAKAAQLAANPTSGLYGGFGDFTYWVLAVDRVRWVGGYGRMDSCSAADYAAAEADPVAPHAAYAVRHLNEDHADALLLYAQKLAGFTDATEAACRRADRHGLDLWVTTPRGKGPARVGFPEPITAPDGLRAATVALVKMARGV